MRNRDRYPDDWEAISARIRRRDGYTCQFCGLPNGAIGYRDARGRWRNTESESEQTLAIASGYEVIQIVISAAHLGVDKPDGAPGDKRDKLDCRDENLTSLCQRCHLLFDDDERAESRERNARQRLTEAGQIEFWSAKT